MKNRSLMWALVGVLTVGILQPPAAFGLDFVYETVIEGFYLSSGRGVAVDEAGNAHVLARWVGEQNENNFVLLKLDPEGHELWRQVVAGRDHDVATDLVVDAAGDLWVTGWTDSDDFPLVDATDGELTGFREAFLMKVAGADGSILFSTYLGGDYTDEGGGIALTSSGEIVLAGLTQSSDFPVVDALQPEINSYPYASSDAFITRLSPDGKTILYSTYLGGWKDDAASDVGLDDSGNIYIVGRTVSDDFPLAAPLQSEYAGGDGDLFVTRLSADGTTLEYSTYLGGADRELSGGIAVDGTGSVFVTGSTRSPDFPTTAGAFQEVFIGAVNGCEVPFGADHNCDDLFVSQLTPDGSELAYSTFIGGSDVEEARGVAIDSSARAHVVGYTRSPDFPADGIDTSAEIVVAQLSANGDALEDTVTVDSGSANAGNGVTVGSDDDVYFSGAVNVPAEIYVARLESGGGSGGPGQDGCGRVPDEYGVGQEPLTVEKALDGSITLNWSFSCVATDDDYAVYEGTLGVFYDHAPRYCSTGGATTMTFPPPSGSAYYLVVPRNGLEEGSYGTDSGAFERPQGSGSCLSQQIGACE